MMNDEHLDIAAQYSLQAEGSRPALISAPFLFPERFLPQRRGDADKKNGLSVFIRVYLWFPILF
jgi:hypothetical protein